MSDEHLEDLAMPSKPVVDSAAVVRTEPWPRRVRGVLGHETVVDSTRTLLQFEAKHLPVWYFPREDVRVDLFERSKKHTKCPDKGTASYWNLVVGDRLVPDAVWSYEEVVDGRDDIAGRFAFYWNKLDAWFEEDDEVFVHPRDPYHRVDVVSSSRHVRIELDGVELANTNRPRLLFETGLPVRYYIPRADVNELLLDRTETASQCPYKGVATYYAARVGGRVVDDIAWTYTFPIPECPKVEGLVAFFDEQVDVWVDGELQATPETPWSRRRA
jgi:uncharacterized protein (DUF427 family)